MGIKKEISTNKARLVFCDNNTVEKQFFELERAKKELESLNIVNSVFTEENIGGWLYKTVKVLSFNKDTSSIKMEEATGVPFSEILIYKPEYSYHMGVWLALYHNNAYVKENRVKRFGDFSRSNFIIDKEKRIATAIDPGGGGGEVDFPEVDIVTGIYSLVLGSLRSRVAPYYVCDTFIKAYNDISKNKIDVSNMLISWKIIRKRFRSKYKKSSILLRPVSYCAMILLNFYITILIKRIGKRI